MPLTLVMVGVVTRIVALTADRHQDRVPRGTRRAGCGGDAEEAAKIVVLPRHDVEIAHRQAGTPLHGSQSTVASMANRARYLTVISCQPLLASQNLPTTSPRRYGREALQLHVNLMRSSKNEDVRQRSANVIEGLSGKAGELNRKGIEAVANVLLVADGLAVLKLMTNSI